MVEQSARGAWFLSTARAICRHISTLSTWSGRLVAWLVPVIIFCICYEVLARFFFNAATVWAYGVSAMTGATLYAIGLAYVWRRGGHVRVDLVRDRFPEWFKTIWEIVFTAVFYLPIVGLLTYISTTSAIEAFRIKELYIETLWMPVTWPYKSLVAVGFGLFFLEGINHLLRNIVKALGEEV